MTPLAAALLVFKKSWVKKVSKQSLKEAEPVVQPTQAIIMQSREIEIYGSDYPHAFSLGTSIEIEMFHKCH